MIIPVGHEQDTVRRLPWVTFGIMIACTAMFLLTGTGSLSGGDDGQAAEDAAGYLFEHPYLEPDPRFGKLLRQAFPGQDMDAALEAMRSEFPPPEDPEALAREQAELDRLTAAALAGLEGDAFRRLGLVPGDPSAPAWITHMFLHAGLLHLLGNLLILYLAGPFIEDVWGRPLFLGFYLASGLFAAGSFALRDPGSMIPLVGASGAIAGVMGAFLVRYRNTTIRFFYIFGLVFRGTFDAPAWVMLPLWFCEQLAMAMMAGGGGGVAYWAHVGGFVFGVAFAAAMARHGIEEKILKPRLAELTETAVISNPAVEQALQAREAGDPGKAWEALDRCVRAEPGNRDAALAYWSLAHELGRDREAVPVMLGLVERELRGGDDELAVRHWLELRAHLADLPARNDLLVRIGVRLIESGRREEGLEALRMALLQGGEGLRPALALRIARAAGETDPRLARGAALLALKHPDLQGIERKQALILAEVHQP